MEAELVFVLSFLLCVEGKIVSTFCQQKKANGPGDHYRGSSLKGKGEFVKIAGIPNLKIHLLQEIRGPQYGDIAGGKVQNTKD